MSDQMSRPIYRRIQAKASDLHHRFQDGTWEDEVYTLLTDFDYLEVRCRLSVADLEDDYQLALKLWSPQDTGRQQVLAAFQERLRQESLRIAQSPEWLFTTFYNYLRWLDAPDGPLYRLCEAAVARRQGQNSVLPLLLRSRFDPRLELPPWLRSLDGHTDRVLAVAVSPDGRFIVSGSADHTVKVWDAGDGRLLRSLEGHTYHSVNAVAVSPDGRFIVSGSNDQTVKVWDAASGRLLRSLEGHTGAVNAVALSADGRTIVSGSSDRTLKVWDAHDGRLLRSLEGHTHWVNAVALSADGRTIVSGADDFTVKVWDAHDGCLLRSLKER